MEWYEVTVKEVVDETPIDRRLVVSVPDGAGPAFEGWRPGQHVLIRVEGADGETRKSALSLASAPGRSGSIDLTVRGEGSFGEAAFRTPAGARLSITAPRGRFRLDADAQRPLVGFGGGSGAAPYRGLVLDLAARGHTAPVTLVVEETRADRLVYASCFAEHQTSFVRYLPTLTEAGPAWTGHRGPVDAGLVATALPDPSDAVVFACGMTAFVDRVTGLAEAAGVPPERILRERWG